MKARDIMTTDIVTVTGDTPVHEVATLMLERGVSGLPVLDENGTLAGMVSEGDLIRRVEIGTDEHKRSWWLGLLTSAEDEARDYVRTHGTLTRDVMSHPVHAVGPDTDIGEIALSLEKHRIKRLPIVDGGKLVGLVSRADLLRALVARQIESTSPAVAKSDREIHEQIVARITGEEWARSAIVNVIVSDAVVHLWGVLDSNAQREALLVLARDTPGVKAVDDHMTRSPTA